ncbi:MAG: hypothetical protein ABI705_03415 [Aestuariivirga sp.]
MKKANNVSLVQPGAISASSKSKFDPVRHTLVDKLLLSIIRAHGPKGSQAHSARVGSKFKNKSEQQRLAQAKEALFSMPSFPGNDEHDDILALREMVYWYAKDRAGPDGLVSKRSGWNPDEEGDPTHARSIRELARQMSKLTTGASNKAKEERLRKKFILAKDKFMFDVVAGNDMEIEKLDGRILRAARDLLILFDIKMVKDFM